MAVPTQSDVDSVASFVEACCELEREPFFGKDEKLGSRTGPGNATTYTMGDRFHFRSALISFRRIWMAKEASHWEGVIKILRRTDLPSEIVSFADHEATEIAAMCARESWPTKLNSKAVINLWLNTVFAHDGLTGQTKRADFESAVATYGHAQFEYAFRLSVKFLGGHFMNLSRLAAQAALEHYRAAHRLKPSFKMGAAFGNRRRERTADGHVIIRQSSTEFFTEETIEERFARVLERRTHADIKFLFDHLESTPTERLRATLRAQSVAELLTLLDGELRVVEMASDVFAEKSGIYASAGLAGKRVNVFIDNVVETHDEGVKKLNKKLAALQTDLLND